MAPYLVQWIEYHALAGFDHFFVLNDCSTDLTHNVLDHYTRSAPELVSYWASPYDADSPAPPQCAPATHVPNEFESLDKLTKVARRQCEWIMAFDLDEYVTGVDLTFLGDFHAFLQQLGQVEQPGLGLKRLMWMVMGSHALERRPRHRLVIETYTQNRMGFWIKTAARSELVEGWAHSSHFPDLANDTLALDPVRLQSPFADEGDFDFEFTATEGNRVCWRPRLDMFLRHYVYLSFVEYTATRTRRRYAPDGTQNMCALLLAQARETKLTRTRNV